MAERKPRAEDFPGAPPTKPDGWFGYFSAPKQPVNLDNHFQWWTYVADTNWRHRSAQTAIFRESKEFIAAPVRATRLAFAGFLMRDCPSEPGFCQDPIPIYGLCRDAEGEAISDAVSRLQASSLSAEETL
jgi:hypothetical protein